LIITNDFPPRIGGIESFVSEICTLLDHDVLVYASGSAKCRSLGPGSTLFSHSRRAASGADAARRRPRCSTAPRLGSDAGDLRCRRSARSVGASLRRAGARQILGLTHGHETWWALVPVARRLLRRIGDSCDHLTTISAYTERRIAGALSPSARHRLLRLSPPVDTDHFRPPGGDVFRQEVRCIAVARLIPQKGLTTLLRAWRTVMDRPTPGGPARELVVVGDGPLRPRLERTIRELQLTGCVRMLGALTRAGVIRSLQQSDVFALPVRTRLAGLNPEGLGLAALEAAACGLPVIIGDSGGARKQSARATRASSCLHMITSCWRNGYRYS
jgi:phosphatidylinositol alpha-1,6-mannosyltransferase